VESGVLKLGPVIALLTSRSTGNRDRGYIQLKIKKSNPITTKINTLPSGPTVPPVSHLGP